MIVLSTVSSHKRGMGHFFRVLQLAEIGRELNKKVLIIINNHSPALKILKQKGLPYRYWNNEIEYNKIIKGIYNQFCEVTWINDKFETKKFEGQYHKTSSSNFFCIEDRGDGVEYCQKHFVFLPWDKLTLSEKNNKIDLSLLPISSKLFETRRKRSQVIKVLVSLGGSDTYSVTPMVVRALQLFNGEINVILGPGSKVVTPVSEFGDSNISYKQNVDDFAAELQNADLLITGGGMTHLEGILNGLPSLIIAMEEHEIVSSSPMCSLGASLFIGFRDKFQIPQLASIDIKAMSSNCLKITQGWSKNSIRKEFFSV